MFAPISQKTAGCKCFRTSLKACLILGSRLSGARIQVASRNNFTATRTPVPGMRVWIVQSNLRWKFRKTVNLLNRYRGCHRSRTVVNNFQAKVMAVLIRRVLRRIPIKATCAAKEAQGYRRKLHSVPHP